MCNPITYTGTRAAVRRRRTLGAGGIAVVAMLLAGCVEIPSESPYPPLYTLLDSNEPIVRLYLAPVLGADEIATHPWFAMKRAGADHFDRWEVISDDLASAYELRVFADGIYGYVINNLIGPDEYPGGRAWVAAEIVGPEADAIIDFIETQSPHYPCRHRYEYFPGPNSNTYARWVLDQTGWNVTLPPSAIGQDFVPDCP